MHLCWSLVPFMIYIGIDICKVKYNVYIAILESTVEIEAVEAPSSSSCFVHNNNFVSASRYTFNKTIL